MGAICVVTAGSSPHWMRRAELSQSIPPAYTEYIGRHAFAQLSQQVGMYPA